MSARAPSSCCFHSKRGNLCSARGLGEQRLDALERPDHCRGGRCVALEPRERQEVVGARTGPRDGLEDEREMPKLEPHHGRGYSVVGR